MRCKKHPCELSSSVGVCASCLRERLSSLIAAQAHVQAQGQAQAQLQLHAQLSRAQSRAAVADDPRKSDTNLTPPPPLLFPRSVSPYVSRRKSEDATWQHNDLQDRRFYSTPQVGPTYTSDTTAGAYRKKNGKFSLWSNLFRSRSDKFESDHRVSSRESCHPPSSSQSPSWFSAIFSGRRKKQSRLFVLEEPANVDRKPRHRAPRGMSPAGTADSDEDCDRSPSVSGYSSETWRSPALASVRRTRPGHSRNVSGITFCLSPLVRASPSRQWNQKNLPQDMAVSGETRVSAMPHLSTAALFCKNRSRKLADFGRVNHNR